jgi:FkbM family methyltransferase
MKTKEYTYKIGRYEAKLPENHKLQVHQTNHPLYDRYFSKWLGVINPDMRILDIGANVGDSALFFATHSKGTVVAIEPVPEFFEFLTNNISSNKLENRIPAQQLVLIPLSFGTKVSFDIDKGTASTKFTAPSFMKRKTQIQSQYLVNFLQDNEGFDLIKTDADGLNLFLIEDVLNSEIAPQSILFFELDHFHYGTGWARKFTQLFEEFESKRYKIIMVDNLGRPFYSLRSGFKDTVQFYSWLEKQKSMNFSSAYYFDIWAFPENQLDAFNAIIELEEMNS